MTTTQTATGKQVKAIGITVLVCTLVGAIAYVWLQAKHRKEIEQLQAAAAAEITALRQTASTVAVELATDLTQVLGTTISDDVARVEHAMLDAQLATIVRGHRVSGVIVMNPNGEVVATTDQRFAGRTLDDAAAKAATAVTEITVQPTSATAPGHIEVAAPLSVGTTRLGTVRVFVDVSPFAEPPN